jgi:hypothetical protein
MWTYEHSAETSAALDAIFALFQNVSTWPQWNPGVESMVLDGPFAAGTTGTMKVPGQEPMRMRLVSVDPAHGFEDETPIPDAGIVVHVRHVLTPLESGGTRITYGMTIDGPAADAVGPQLGPEITNDFPAVVAALIAMAEGASVTR